MEEEPLGTAGGVRNAVDLVGGLVLVLNGDILTDADLSARCCAFHASAARAATLVPHARAPIPPPYGLVELAEDGRVRRFIEKPDPSQVTTDTVNAGIYVLDARLLARIPRGRAVSIEREFFPGCSRTACRSSAGSAEHYWLDIGSPAKYRQGQLDLLAGRVATPLVARGRAGRRPLRGVGRGAGAGRDASTSPAVIGAGCRVGGRRRVGPSAVLGDRMRGRAAGATVDGRHPLGARGGRRRRRAPRLHHRRRERRMGAGARVGSRRGGRGRSRRSAIRAASPA